MYFPYFIAYIAIGLGISLLVFCWALKTGQFREQQRARFLPLRGEPPAHNRPARRTRVSSWRRLEIYGLFFLAAAGLAASASVLLYALYFSK